jgi:hypothetical protein
MFMHPTVTTGIADQHRRHLITQADTYQPALIARQGYPRRLASPVLTTRRVLTTGAAACTAAAVFLLAPAGPAHTSAHHFLVPTAAGQVHFSHRA